MSRGFESHPFREMKTLKEICEEYRNWTDKDTGHAYVSHYYEDVFRQYRLKKNVLVELGVYLGGSAQLFNDYFENSQIYGLELQPKAYLDEIDCAHPRIHFMYGDAYSDTVIELVPNMDIFIDDGTHYPKDQLIAVEKYLPKVNPGGLFIIEDVSHPDLFRILAEKVPSELKPYIQNVDLRHVRNVGNDLLFVVAVPEKNRRGRIEA